MDSVGNLYPYVGSDPINFVDPVGNFAALLPIAYSAAMRFSLGFTAGYFAGFAIEVIREGRWIGSALQCRLVWLGPLIRPVPFGGLILQSSSGEQSPVPPSTDETGKVHGDLPSHVPDSWNDDDINDAIDDLQRSLETREREQRTLGEDGPHRERMRQEQNLLRQLRTKRGF